MTWKPQPRAGVDPFALPLDARQGYLLTLADGAHGVAELALLTGQDEAEVRAALARLVALGALQPEGGTAPPPAPAMAPEREPEPEPPLEAPSEAAAEGDPAEGEATTHRERFETLLRGRGTEARVALAKTAVEPDLSALCFDPLPEVVQALLENPRFVALQARLVAAHHRTSAGLEALSGRTAFAHDEGVRRGLLRNPILPPALYRRLWSNRRLQEQFLVATSKEAPEQTRTMAREVLRATFTQRQGEERAELIVNTEGRCLALLPTATLDGQATAILCRRTYSSTLFIQNLARWSACPPQLIAHLRRQDLVKRNTVLRQMLERHPNAS